jgi:hypothetical protein
VPNAGENLTDLKQYTETLSINKYIFKNKNFFFLSIFIYGVAERWACLRLSIFNIKKVNKTIFFLNIGQNK